MLTYRQNILRIVKDVAFIVAGFVLMGAGRFLGVLAGLLIVGYYGFQLYATVKIMRLQKETGKGETSSAPSKDDPFHNGKGPEAAPDDGKLRVTDLSGAKEVEFEKE